MSIDDNEYDVRYFHIFLTLVFIFVMGALIMCDTEEKQYYCRFYKESEESNIPFKATDPREAAEIFAMHSYDYRGAWKLCNFACGTSEWEDDNRVVVTSDEGKQCIYTIIVEHDPTFTATEDGKASDNRKRD